MSKLEKVNVSFYWNEMFLMQFYAKLAAVSENINEFGDI